MYKDLNLFGYFLYFELLSALTRKAFNDVVELTVGIVPIVEGVTGVSKLGVCGLLGCGVLLCCMCALMRCPAAKAPIKLSSPAITDAQIIRASL